MVGYVRGANGLRHLGIVLVESRAGTPACVPGQAGSSFPANTEGGGMPAYQWGGQAALVTGAASGIGFATVSMLGRGGACVAVNVLLDDPVRDRGV